MDRLETYQSRIKERTSAREQLAAKSRLLSLARVIVALLALAALGLSVWGNVGLAGPLGLVAALVGFVALVIVHGRVAWAESRRDAAVRYFQRGVARLEGRFREAGNTALTGAEASHLYALDIDIVGQSSLVQLIDTTETALGRTQLLQWVLEEPTDFPHAVTERQHSVQDLSTRLDFREQLAVAGAVQGSASVPTTPMSHSGPTAPVAPKKDEFEGPFFRWAEGELPLAMSWKWPSRILVAITLTSIALSSWLPKGIWACCVVAQLLATMKANGQAKRIVQVVLASDSQLLRYGEMLKLIEREPFEAAALTGVVSGLRKSEVSKEMSRLSNVLSFAQARSNEVFRIFIGPVFLWDLQCAFGLEAWRLRSGAQCRAWLRVLAEVEALSSLATVAFEHPSWTYPKLVSDPIFAASQIGHPLIAEKSRVNNDVRALESGEAFVVTGSNMSGKSTLLRSIGTNVVLARAGAPVCAETMTLGRVTLATSMRISDSLEGGISHFHAELIRLRRVLERTGEFEDGGPAVLFLLDEILHGTNNRERLLGASEIIRQLLGKGAMGFVSTHDLGLADLEGEFKGRVRNVHFEEQVEGDVMTFDYRMRDGVVQSSNALRLMSAMKLIPEIK